MPKVKVNYQTRLEIEGIVGFIERKVTPFGTGAQVICPKEYMGRKVLLVILNDEQ